MGGELYCLRCGCKIYRDSPPYEGAVCEGCYRELQRRIEELEEEVKELETALLAAEYELEARRGVVE